MGSGLAKQIREMYPFVYTAYKTVIDDKTLTLGKTLIVEVEEDLYIANLAGQEFYD